MPSAESRRGRRIVGALERGVELIEALRGVCRRHGVRAGELRATGALESAEVAAYDQIGRRWREARTLAGGLELVQMAGTIAEDGGQLSIVARAAMMRERDSGVEMVGGVVTRATVFAVEFVIDAFDDVVVRSGVDAMTGLRVWKQIEAEAETSADPGRRPREARPESKEPAPAPAPVPVPAPAPAPVPVPAPAPAPVPVAASRPAPGVDHVSVHPGDVLVHPRFGRVTILRVEGEQEFAHIQLRNNRVVRLSLEVMTLRALGAEGGQRVFEASLD
jgi:predicted DNA-binding protein with PD1-like motif